MREEGYVLNGKEKRMTGERRGRREREGGGWEAEMFTSKSFKLPHLSLYSLKFTATTLSLLHKCTSSLSFCLVSTGDTH